MKIHSPFVCVPSISHMNSFMNHHLRILYCLIVMKHCYLEQRTFHVFSLLIILFLFSPTRGFLFNGTSRMPTSSSNWVCDVSWTLSLQCDLLLFDCRLVSFFPIHPEFSNQSVLKMDVLWILANVILVRNPSIFHISMFHQ